MLYRRWVVAFTLGELIGFGLIPALGGSVAYAATDGLDNGPRALLLYVVAVVGGLGEGAVLARFQLGPMREVVPELDARLWIGATAFAASLAWAAGMLAPTLDDLVGLSSSAQVGIWMPALVLILLSIGSAQAWVLRGHVARPHRWVIANVLGWLGGLPFTFVLPMALPDDAPVALFFVAMFVGGVLMGATAGAITGWWLLRLRQR
jgi:hypothetical protein